MLTARYEPHDLFRSSKPILRRKPHKQTPVVHFDEELKRDRFIELAQAALEQAIKEEDQKGVIREMVEALIARSGAPLVAEVISEQMRSQDLIEQLAERHQERRQLNDDTTPFPHTLKEPLDETLRSVNTAATYDETVEPMTLMAEYMWRFFRLLLLASIVGLIYHFLCAYSPLTQS